MNPAKKIAAGIAVVAVATAAGLPAITGHMLENSIKEQLPGTAEQYHYSVSSVSVNRSYTETTVEITLEGYDLRQLSRESLEITGTLQHANIFSLPNIAHGDFDYTYSIYQEGVRTELPGTVKGAIDWQGNIQAELVAEGVELPVDTVTSTTMTIQPVTASMTVTGNYGEREVKMALDTLSWSIQEYGEELGAISLAPSQLGYSSKTSQWHLDVPLASLNQLEDDGVAPLTVENIKINGHQSSENDLIHSSIHMETGAVIIPELEHLNGGKLIEGFAMKSSIDNVSQSAIQHLSRLFQALNVPGHYEEIEELSNNFLVELTRHNPRFALEDLSIKTANGDISLAFHIESDEKVSTLMTELAEFGYLAPGEEDEFMLRLAEGLSSSAKITLSDEMLDWACDQVGEQVAFEQGGSQVEARLFGGMCKTLTKSGDFMRFACREASTPSYQYQCTRTVEQAKKLWQSDRSLELTLEEGQLMLNGSDLELPIM